MIMISRMTISSRTKRTAPPMIAMSRLPGKALTDNAANSTDTYHTLQLAEKFTGHGFNFKKITACY